MAYSATDQPDVRECPDQVEPVDSKMTADGFQILHVLLNAPVAGRIRAPAVTRIVCDQRIVVRKASEVVEENDAIGDQDLRATPQLLEIEPNSVFRGDMIFSVHVT